MESILNDLSRIKDLRAISRSSVEKYRDSAVNIPDVAKELMVSYVLEGSMQKYGNHISWPCSLKK
jgi:TolB-like protein